MFDLTNTD